MDAPMLMVRPIAEGLAPQFGRGWFERSGIEFEGQVPGATTRQHLAWCDDTAGEIMVAFNDYVELNGLAPPSQEKKWVEINKAVIKTAGNTDEETAKIGRASCR